MTREDLECIAKWFAHIEQMATDRKNANGVVVENVDYLLNTIKVTAKDSREYVEKFCLPAFTNEVDGVVRVAGISSCVATNGVQLKASLKRFKDGDKVKVIIIKE